MFRCNEVVTNTKNLILTKSFVNEGRLPECTSKGIDLPGKCLGLVRGCGFMGDYMSDNGRWYPSQLWKNTCDADYVKDMIANRLMFGTCGHPNTPGDEHPIIVDYLTDWEMGKGFNSHCITDLNYDNEPMGVIEYVIMDTDWGKNLYAHLATGAKLSVSSRAMGDYIPGELHDGCPIMDPDNYMLDTFDIVRIPGINVATPNCVELRESIDKKITEAQNAKSKIMISTATKPEDFSVLLI